MNVCIDSSALLETLLEQPRADEVRGVLGRAHRIYASELLLVECARAWRRRHPDARELPEEARVALDACELVEVDMDVIERAMWLGDAFVRSLDAVHVATADLLRAEGVEGLVVVTLDGRMRDCAAAMGFAVLP